MGVERLSSQLVKWSSRRSWDASLKAFCRIEGATSNRKRGERRWGCQGGQVRGSPVHRPRANAQSYGGLAETAGALAING